jgi:hypothetical protein
VREHDVVGQGEDRESQRVEISHVGFLGGLCSQMSSSWVNVRTTSCIPHAKNPECLALKIGL